MAPLPPPPAVTATGETPLPPRVAAGTALTLGVRPEHLSLAASAGALALLKKPHTDRERIEGEFWIGGVGLEHMGSLGAGSPALPAQAA